MNPNSAIFQIILLGLAAGIGYFYVYPTVLTIGSLQDQIADYEAEQDRIASVNTMLNSLLQESNTISAANRQKLDVYLPRSVDTIAVSRTVQAIIEQSGVIVSSVETAGLPPEASQNPADTLIISDPVSFDMSFTVSGTYEQIKGLLRLLEQNDFPLEVTALALRATNGSFLEAEVTVRTYQLSAADVIQ